MQDGYGYDVDQSVYQTCYYCKSYHYTSENYLQKWFLKVCTVILIIVSGITISIIDNNKDINDIRKGQFDSLDQLENLVTITRATAEWLIVFNVIILVWEIAHIILSAISPRYSLLQRYCVIIMTVVRLWCMIKYNIIYELVVQSFCIAHIYNIHITHSNMHIHKF